MKKILFVDDEPNVLSGLQRMLRGMRNKWEMAFVASGQEALALLSQRRFDIIVSDMRMPVMDGADLLIRVRTLYPHMVRIILSGHSSQPVVMKSVRPAHQYLAKPCESDKLISVLNNACLLSEFLGNEDLAGLVSQMEAIPTLGETYRQLMDELNSEDASLRKIGEIISRDMGMTATVLKVVNSAFFGLQREISKPVDAVQLLGLDVVKGLAMSAHIFSCFDMTKVPGFSFDGLWRHSMNTGCIAKGIALAEGGEKKFVDEAFIAGLMHDLGKLVLASLVPVEYNGVLELVRLENRLLWQVEREVLGATHSEVGAFLMGLWGMSENIVQALALHHRPGHHPDKRLNTGLVVHAANVIEHEVRVVHQNYARRTIDAEMLAEAGLAGKVDEWMTLGRELLEGEANNERCQDPGKDSHG